MLTRRQFLKLSAALVGGAVASAAQRVSPLRVVAQEPLRAPELMTVRGDQFFYRGARFPVKGFNYYPRAHPWRTFNLGEWEPQVTERELGQSVELGANVVRAFIDFNYSLDNAKAQQRIDFYFAPIARYVANVREFLDIAARLNLQVIVTLFDSMDRVFYQTQNHWIAEAYLQELIPPFVNDPRIFCWDLQNEPDRALRDVGAPVVEFFKRVAEQVRRIDPRHLQTIGWIDRARAAYFSELDNYLDFWCFHFYDKAERLPDLVKFYKAQTAKPVLLEEFGLATGGPGADGAYTERDQAAHYASILATLEDNTMCGAVPWCLNDFPVGLAGNPPLTTDSPENHYGVLRLDYSEKPVAAVLKKFWRGVPLPGTNPQ